MIKKLAKSIREYKTQSILSPIFITMEVVMEVVIPLLMAQLIDKGINNESGDMNAILLYGGLLVGCCVISLLFGILSGRSAAIASAGFSKNLRHDMYYAVQDYSFSNIDKFSSASIVTRLTTDVNNVQNAFMMIIRVAVRSPMMLAFSLIMSFTIHKELSLIFLAAIPILGFSLYFIMSRVHPIFERVFKTYDKLNRVVQENLRGIRVVKSFVREEHETQKFNEVSGTIYKDFSKAEKRLSFNMPIMQGIVYACLLLISWFGARIIVVSGGTEMSTGQLMSLITYSSQILMSLMMFSMVFVMITISRASAERIVEVLDEKANITNPENPKTEICDGSIDFENVSFGYSEKSQTMCLKNINLNIKSGETIGIIGATGSAKTTLVQLIPRLYDATQGRVLVGGVDVREYDIKSLRDEVAMVLQKNVLFSGTIAENLRWGNENATDEELVSVCKAAQADSFINELPDGYKTHIEQGGSNVSGGQKQRLCIARALLKKPKILILDDSTSAVDTRTDALIQRSFCEKIPNTTTIIIAQRISSVQNADRIIVMEGGELDAVGTHAQLLADNSIYREVFDSQNKSEFSQNGGSLQ